MEIIEIKMSFVGENDIIILLEGFSMSMYLIYNIFLNHFSI